jgi:hypothetical protein
LEFNIKEEGAGQKHSPTKDFSLMKAKLAKWDDEQKVYVCISKQTLDKLSRGHSVFYLMPRLYQE